MENKIFQKNILKSILIPRIVLSISVFTLSLPSYSMAQSKTKKLETNYAVNMQDGGLILKESGFNSNVDRTYRSRSLDHGFFGQGWCSDFESSLVFQGRGVIRLVNCQSSRPSLFKITETASSYRNVDNSNDVILIRLGFYERQILNEKIARYDFKGKLTEVIKNKQTYKLMYNTRSLPEKILVAQNKLITLQWHPILDLVEAVSVGEKKETLKYEGFNLIRSTSGSRAVNYVYDDLDNLTSRKDIKYSLNFFVEYDRISDRVLKIEGLCLEQYSYKQKSPKRTISTVSKTCQDQGSKTEFNFEYADNLLKPSQIVVNSFPLKPLERLSLNQGGSL